MLHVSLLERSNQNSKYSNSIIPSRPIDRTFTTLKESVPHFTTKSSPSFAEYHIETIRGTKELLDLDKTPVGSFDEGMMENASQHVNDANNAADEAEKAAVVAKESAHSDEDHKAADAAGQAASAAKKAAQATSDAAADSAMESLLSGDGAMMTSIMSTCFSDPKYGIKKPFTEEGQVHEGSSDGTSNAFIYVDGLHYYRVNLTAPFMQIESLDHSIPLPNFLPEGKGDPIDIALATAIIGGFFFGIIVLLHHIRVLDWDMRLQFKWFFHPRQESLKRGGYSRSISTAEYPDDLSLEDTSNDVELSSRGKNIA